jgi:hypothetical protein
MRPGHVEDGNLLGLSISHHLRCAICSPRLILPHDGSDSPVAFWIAFSDIR